jgi:peptidyl-tRNA hydrolase
MSPGKAASQAGHAYLGAFLAAHSQTPETALQYASDLPGTKVCLEARNEEDILRIQDSLRQHNIPHFLVVDSGCPNFFDGQPIITAIGFGPSLKHAVKPVTKRLKLLA